jgi:hypothetical protein
MMMARGSVTPNLEEKLNANSAGRCLSRRIWSSLALTGLATLLTASAPLFAQGHDCQAEAPSADRVPAWYPIECGGGAVETISPGAPSVPGDLYFAAKIFPAPQEIVSAPLPTRAFTPHGATTNNLFAIDYDNSATVLWGITSQTTPSIAFTWGTINESTGVYSSLGSVTGLVAGATNISGISFDPTSPTVYISSVGAPGSTLYTFNLSTGVATSLGTMTGFVIDIAIDNSGQMWAHDIGGDQLLRVDKANGASTPVGPTGLGANFAQGLDFDPSDGALYGFVTVNSPAVNNHVGTFNLTTGAFSISTSGPEELEGAVKVPVTAPFALAISGGNGNLVLETNESAIVMPRWRNGTNAPIALAGTFSNFTGPAGPTYTLFDSTGNYGTIAGGNNAECTDCYGLDITTAVRPTQHWDATALETISPTGTAKTWALHVGESFSDVPMTNPFYRFVETIFHKSITAGCGGTSYCPGSSTTREQMAVFVLVAKDGVGVLPPVCAPPNLFGDVPESSPFCRFIEELANRGVVSGCGGGNYCPTDPVTREQMAVFVLVTLDPTLNPPACAPPNTFNDVPETSPFCRWIEELAARGVVTGCGGGNYCPTDPVTREQMGVFLTVTFGLTLYGP